MRKGMELRTEGRSMNNRKRANRQSKRALRHYYYRVSKWNVITGLGWQLSEYFAGKPLPPVNPNLRYYAWDVASGKWITETEQ
jgi:hypothetical protein